MSMTVSEYVHRGRRLAPIPGTAWRHPETGITWSGVMDADTGQPLGDDYALCLRCGALCDVGGEMRYHYHDDME